MCTVVVELGKMCFAVVSGIGGSTRASVRDLPPKESSVRFERVRGFCIVEKKKTSHVLNA